MWKANLLVWGLDSLPRNPHLTGKFLGDHKLTKVTAAETVEEFAVFQSPSSILRERRGFFSMIPITLKNTEQH